MARANLLHRLASDSSERASLRLNAKLKQALSPATFTLLRAVVQEAEKENSALYLVGGFVRDLLLERPSLDLDFVLEGDAIRLGRALVKRLGGRLTVHKAFGTAVWWLADDQANILRRLRVPQSKSRASHQLPKFLDLISARRETYARSGALPDVRFADIHADQYRRDFTINTLALRLDGPLAGQLLDPWGGLDDLRLGFLRTLHAQSFSDDPTRILRILRLAGRLKFKVESQTLTQLKASLRAMDLVSSERIRKELELVLEEDRNALILRSMQQLGVLRSIHPGLQFNNRLANLQSLLSNPAPSYWELEDVPKAQIGFVLWLMHLSPTVVAAIAERLRFPADLRAAAVSASRLRARSASLQKLRPSKLVAALEREPLLSVYALFLLNKNNKLGKLLQHYAKEWRHLRLSVDGNALRKMGLKPGPAYSEILDRLRAAWLDGELRNKKQELTLLEKLVNEHRQNN